MRQTIPKLVLLVAAVAIAGGAALMAYGSLGPKTEPPAQPATPTALDLEHNYPEIEKILLDTQRAALTLSRCPPQPLQQDEARQTLRDAYGDAAQAVWSCFYDDELDNPAPEPRYNQEGIFFPMLFHQNIEIENAYTHLVEDSRGGEVSELVVREHYTGGDPLLTGFRRAHIYRLDENGEWKFHRFEGAAALEDAELFSTYLPLREGFA